MLCTQQIFEIEVRRRWSSSSISIDEVSASFGLSPDQLRAALPQFTHLSFRSLYLRGIAKHRRAGIAGTLLGFQTDDPPDEPDGPTDEWDVDWDQFP